jgi:outer membrane protein OmpA-like peptidoglycan-associated protein
MHFRKMGAAPTAMPMRVASAPDFVFDSRTLRFDLNEAALKPGAGETLSAVVDFLNDYPEISVRIADHTCWLGSNEHNLHLSRRRAEAVAAYLISQGVDWHRLVVAAEGESQPAGTNLTEVGRASNRRVEVVRL